MLTCKLKIAFLKNGLQIAKKLPIAVLTDICIEDPSYINLEKQKYKKTMYTEPHNNEI